MYKIAKYVLYDILRNKIVIGYTLFLLAVSLSFFNLESDTNKGLLSLLNIILIVVPLVSIILSTIHFYNSYEFIELMLAQPLRRSVILAGEYIGVGLALSFSFLIGIGVPVLLFDFNDQGLMLLVTGLFLTLVFVSLAFLASVLTRDKARGIGVALLLWFYFSLLYDGLVLLILFTFGDYPLEKAVLSLTFLNPVDLARVMILLKMDTSALMGYTSALFKSFLGAGPGITLAFGVMFLWVIIPIGLAMRIFRKKDL